MFGRLRKAGAKVAKLDNLGLPSLITTPGQNELNTTDFTKEQRKKRTDVICI